MISSKSGIKLILGLGLALSTFAVSAQTIGLTLSGSQEVPAVITSATAVAAI